MSHDLKKKTKIALLWSVTEKAGQQIIYLITGIITARLLAVTDFGLVGSLAIFTAISNILLESGFSIALIRKNDADDKDYNTVFLFNLGVSIVLYGILFLGAPLIAKFLDNPEITRIARVLFSVIIIYSLGIIHTTMLIKRMDFRKITIINIISLVISAGISIYMAMNGYGVWSLVTQQIIMASLRTILLWSMCSWHPTFKFNKQAFTNLFGYSSKLLAGSLINTISSYFYSFILGGYFPMRSVGHYVQANKMKNMAAMSLFNAFGSSTYSMLSNLQDDNERLKRATRKTMSTVAYFAFPVMLGLGLVAKPLIELTIGFKWLPAVPLMQLLCISGVLFVMSSMNGNLIKLSGRSEEIVKLEMTSLVVMLLFLVVAVRFGILAAVAGDAVSKLIMYYIYMKSTAKITDYNVKEQLADIAQYAVISVIMVVLLYPFKILMDNPFRLLTTQALLGIGFYFFANKYMGSPVQDEIVSTILKKKE
ncbi:MAG: lipopolysaccharide biosynthesis protein [Rikenellaceae bacterium]|nr:lipopolysaccharide biosynthesis protein [Rikenellaceae bacterium]